MDEKFHEMLAFVLYSDGGLGRSRARSIASYFLSLDEFMTLKSKDLGSIKTVSGKKVELSKQEIETIKIIQKSNLVDPKLTTAQNYLSAVARAFTKRQLSMIRELSLDKINVNPFLVKALNLHNPEEVVRLNVYMVTTRSIVTSMGFFIQNLLIASSERAEGGPEGSGWDLVKVDAKSKRHWIQIKSGPNDMDRDQVVYWAQKINEKVLRGDKAYIGITYGKRSMKTVTFGILKQLLPDWEMKTLIGKELWDFVSDDPNYHAKLFDTLRVSAQQILHSSSISDEIEKCITRVRKEFIERYGDGEKGVKNYIDEIF